MPACNMFKMNEPPEYQGTADCQEETMINQGLKSVTLALLCCILFTNTARAELSLGIGLPSVEIGGDMDGESLVAGGGSFEILPDQDDGDGTKLSIGFFSEDGSIDVSWVETDHDGEWLGLDTESEYQSLNIDAKFAVLGEGKLRGLVMIGLGFMSVKIDDGSVGTFEVDDAEFDGLDFRLGIGARYRVMKNLALEANMIRRIGSYDHVDGVVSGDISDSIDGDGVTTSIELIYIFAKE